MSDLHILLVEDEIDGQEVVSTILQYSGITVDVVGNATSALQNLQHITYDAAIIDIALPDMDGWGLLGAIRELDHAQNMPCMAITAFHDSSVKQKSLEVGFDAYLPKPLNADNLLATLDKLVTS